MVVVVQPLGFGVDAVGDDVVELAGAVDGAAVGQVAAVEQVHAHDRATQGHQGAVDGAVGRAAGQGLDVGPDLVGWHAVGRKGFGGAAAGQRFQHVHVLDALVVAPVGVAAVVGQLDLVVEDLGLGRAVQAGVGVALGVDVLKDGAQGLAHGGGRLALGGDEDQFARLALGLVGDEAGDGGV